jgi:hypothetical protein
VAANTQQWMKFWPKDWESDECLKVCSLAARGLWASMICLMHKADPYGHLIVNGKAPDAKRLAAVIGATTEREVGALLKELESEGVFSRTDDGIIYSRRMTRDSVALANAIATGQTGGNPQLRRGTVPKEQRVRPFKRSDSPNKTRRIFEKRGGRCWWCDVILQTEMPGPDFFHVDHFIGVGDGGTNEEDNLVPSCSFCNHDRARANPTRTYDDIRHQPPVGVGTADRQDQADRVGQISRPEPPVGVGDAPTRAREAEAEVEAEVERKKEPDLRSGADNGAVKVGLSVRDALWRDGPPILRVLLGTSDRQTRNFLGGLTKLAHDDCSAVYAALREAESLRPIEPQAWLRQACTPKGERAPKVPGGVDPPRSRTFQL